MFSLNSSPPAAIEPPGRFDRLRGTTALSGEGFDRWQECLIGVIGAGNLGSRFAPEAVRCGASVAIIDPDIGRVENLGTQIVRPGVPKAEAVRMACDEIVPGRASALAVDVRRVGIGKLFQMDMLVDATDDPNLTLPLAKISNGLGKPLLRIALDGTGQRELGRVAVSDGGRGQACGCCGYTLDDLIGRQRRQPCPGAAAPDRPPTLASGALGMAIAGAGLIQAMRLITGNGAELAVGHELILDLSGPQLFSVHLPRCDECVTGHVRWTVTMLSRTAEKATLSDMFCEAGEELGVPAETLEAYAHPLWTAAVCGCGGRCAAFGGPWSLPPACDLCGAAMEWLPGSQRAVWTRVEVDAAGLAERPLAALGLPSGAMLVGRAADHSPVRLVLA